MAVDDRVPLFVGHLLDDVVPGITSVVDDDVNTTVVLDGSLNETLGEIGGGHTADAGNGFTTGLANFSHDFFGRRRVQIVDHNFSAVGCQLQCDATTDTTTGTGDQGDFAFKLFH
ncbi:hypothetical protein D3C77_73140 [compost metagenome]